MSEVIIDPLCLLGISSYHQKNLPQGLGASIGALYAVQKQLSYKICISQPLGTHNDSVQQIVNRLVEYEILKNRKAKNNINYYDEYQLIGWYFMGNYQKYLENQKGKYRKIAEAFQQRSAPYFLKIYNHGQTQLFKNGDKIKYSAKLDTLQKYCSDTMYLQSSKKEPALHRPLKKEKHSIQLYNKKLLQIKKSLLKCDDNKKRQIKQLISTYERMQYFGKEKKINLNQTINYNLLTAMIIDYQQKKSE